jgi:hypothetical protein
MTMRPESRGGLLGQAKGLLDKWGFVGKPNKSEDESAAQRSDSKKQPRSETARIRPRNHSLAGDSNVTGYDFSRTVSKNKKNNSLLPQAVAQRSEAKKIEAAAQLPLRASQAPPSAHDSAQPNYPISSGIAAHRSNAQRR